jgi:hypothetical protein
MSTNTRQQYRALAVRLVRDELARPDQEANTTTASSTTNNSNSSGSGIDGAYGVEIVGGVLLDDVLNIIPSLATPLPPTPRRLNARLAKVVHQHESESERTHDAQRRSVGGC